MPIPAHPRLLLLAALVLAPGAARAAAFPSGWERALVARSDSLHAAGARAGADALLDEAIALARSRSDDAALARLLIKRGGRRTWFGDPRGGEAPLREALRLADAARDTPLAASAAAFLAAGLNETGRAADAERLLLDRLRRSGPAAIPRSRRGPGTASATPPCCWAAPARPARGTRGRSIARARAATPRPRRPRWSGAGARGSRPATWAGRDGPGRRPGRSRAAPARAATRRTRSTTSAPWNSPTATRRPRSPRSGARSRCTTARAARASRSRRP